MSRFKLNVFRNYSLDSIHQATNEILCTSQIEFNGVTTSSDPLFKELFIGRFQIKSLIVASRDANIFFLNDSSLIAVRTCPEGKFFDSPENSFWKPLS